jgi:hypothetical protein
MTGHPNKKREDLKAIIWGLVMGSGVVLFVWAWLRYT